MPTINPNDLQIKSPAPAVAAPAAPPPVQPQPAPRVPLEDRQLAPEEVESLLRGIQPTEEPETSNADDPEQAKLAQDFFYNLPMEGGQKPLPPKLPTEAVQQIAETQPADPTPVQPQQVPIQQTDPQIAALQAQNSLLQAQIEAMQKTIMQQAPTPQQQIQRQPQPQPQQAAYGFNVPDQYLQALASDDANTRRAALNGLLNGVAEVVTQNVRQEMEGRFQSVPQEIQSHLQVHNKAQEVQRDMFGTYPELLPHRAYVQAAAQQLTGNLGLEAWNQDVRDAIAERVAPLVPGLMQKVQSNRAQRISLQNGGYQMPPGQPLPQAPGPQAPSVPAGYSQPVGGIHGGPVYVRDAAGNLVPYQPQQQFVAGQQTRPGGRAVDPQLQDIWSTLNF